MSLKSIIISSSLLCLLLSCSFREQDDLIINTVTESDTFIYNPETKDSVHIKNNFIVLKESDSIDFNIEKIVRWMGQPSGKRSKQGGDAHNGILFQFQSGHAYVDIIDVENKTTIATVETASYDDYHCNNADFGNVFCDEKDDFPLLYSSQQGRNARCIVIDRITKQGTNFNLETVQRIDLPYEHEGPLQYTPDAVIDKENGFIYVYTGNTIPITDFYIYKFRLPKIEEGLVIQLRETDIISKWMISNNPAYYKQGGGMIGSFLITLEGKSDNKMRVIDLENNRYKLINLTSTFGAKWEPEDIFEVDGELFMASGGTGIYQIVLSNEQE